MNKEAIRPKTSFNLRGSGAGYLFIFLCIASCLLSLCSYSEAKIYIDITAPSFKKLPIAITEFAGTAGSEVTDIVRADLDFTGIFSSLDRNTFIEPTTQTFNPKNWSVIGVELVLKGDVRVDKNTMTATVILYDVSEGTAAFKKEYSAEASHINPLAHAISNDLYKHITGEPGMFRTKIAYVVREAGHDSLNLMDWDGRRANKLDVKGSLLLAPRWSRDGIKLIYSSERYRQWGIYLLDLKKMTEKTTYLNKSTNMTGDFFPDSDEFAFSSSMGGTNDIYTYKVSEAKLSRLTSSMSIDISPTVSPDGKEIAFVSDRNGSPQIFVMSRDGYDLRRITFNGPYNTSPSWSPKGGKIAFSGRHNGKNQIYIINPDGSGTTQLTDRGNNEDPSFSPDERYIVFTSDRDGEKAIYIMRSNGEAQKRITPRGLRAFGPRWSPN